TDPASADAYPISSFTWLLIPSRIPDRAKGDIIKQFLGWMLSDGQAMTTPLNYAPLPPAVIDMERRAIDKITVGGYRHGRRRLTAPDPPDGSPGVAAETRGPRCRES